MRGLALPYVTANGFGPGIDSRRSGGGWTVPAAPVDESGHSGPATSHGVLPHPGGQDGGRDLSPAQGGEAEATATDGRLLVSSRAGVLRVAEVGGNRTRLRGTLDLKPYGIEYGRVLLAGDRALIFGETPEQEGDCTRKATTSHRCPRADFGFSAGDYQRLTRLLGRRELRPGRRGS